MRKILIADDERIERQGIRSLLERKDYNLEILEAGNGKEALEIARSQKPDILLSDIKMPFMTGLELIEKVRQFDSEMAIIIFSGYSDFEYARLAIKYGVLGYVLKPVNPSEFYNVIDKTLIAIDEKKQTEVLMQRNQDFLEQFYLQKYLNTGRLDIKAEAMATLDVFWWEQIRQMILIETATDFFEEHAEDFETELAAELKLPFHYLNLSATSSLLFFDDKVKVDYAVLGQHIHGFIKDHMNAECYVAVSSTITSDFNMADAYQEVEILMENRFYRSDMWVYMPDINWEGKDNYDVVVDLLEKMENDVRLRDLTHLWEHFRKFAAQKQQGGKFSHIFMKFSCSNIVKEMYKDMNFSSDKCADAIEKLYQCTTVQEIIDILEQNIQLYEDTMFSNQSGARSDVEKVKSYVYEHYADELSVEILGKGVYLSPGYMSYIFKKETGEGLTHFIREFRLEKAKELLCTTNKKIVQICKETGFTNASYFCKSFREYYGCSPEKFRKTAGNGEDIG